MLFHHELRKFCCNKMFLEYLRTLAVILAQARSNPDISNISDISTEHKSQIVSSSKETMESQYLFELTAYRPNSQTNKTFDAVKKFTLTMLFYLKKSKTAVFKTAQA